MFKLLLLFFITSCSFFVSRIDTPLVADIDIEKQRPEAPGFCPLDKKVEFQLVGNSDNSQVVYYQLVKNIGKSQLDFMDHFALWNLLQLAVRPDQSSATSRIQVLLHKDGRSSYFDFFSELSENQFPYLYGIEWILKKYGNKRGLEYYAQILDNSIGSQLKISKDFENFLVKNLQGIKNDPELAPFYFRGVEILKENETAPTLSYKKVVALYRKHQKDQKIIINTSLTQFVTEKGNSGSCNYDFNLYDNSIFLIDKIIPVANLYGLALPNAAFMASSSQKLDKIASLDHLPLFKGESKVRSSAVCMIENKDAKIWAISNQSRDPGQHLFHLVRYGLPGSQTTSEVNRLIRHSRHLFLSDPVRLIIESGRSSEDQIENLLKLNLPIYNADKLGNIWSYTMFKEGNRFIIDDRNPGAFTCK
ncbi:hypothetical protein [Peredibacter starrii]|uniref:Uncharacterized protein n=1 Tax=Peredibacter starrii TaxID=28202 RepID=A0AAX4HKG5_9BACT|nr:hypothetical protein [Peredibacter starrii]WPU63732.1 hypothetical protein SOO65_13640 [Peredibacter starrii]